MPKVNFSDVDDVQDYSPLPDGRYLCRLEEANEATTQHGDEMWKLRFAVADGPHKGRLIFDNLVFSPAAMKRAKLICSRLGLDVSQEIDLTPSMLKGRTCFVAVGTEEYQDSEGVSRKRNVVPFAGYENASKGNGETAPPAAARPAEDDGEEGMPF